MLYVAKKVKLITTGGSAILVLFNYDCVFVHSPSDNARFSELQRISPEVPGQKCLEGGHFPIKKGTFLAPVSKDT